MLENAGIHIDYCIESLHYADNGIPHYEFVTGWNEKNERNIFVVEIHYNGEIYGFIDRKTVIDLDLLDYDD